MGNGLDGKFVHITGSLPTESAEEDITLARTLVKGFPAHAGIYPIPRPITPFPSPHHLPYNKNPTTRRDGRADEGACLENRYVLTHIVGSNPTPSAVTLRPENSGVGSE